jgi:NADPH:quinone reductase-like Zn-dependent oxidoreductase
VETLLIGVRDLPAKVRAATGGKGADMVFDLVGGVMFRNAVNSLALRGRLVEIAATGSARSASTSPISITTKVTRSTPGLVLA